MQTELTVLMPNYNNEPFLKEAIESVLNQTFSDFIFLIIDDGSTDKSIEIIKSFADKRIVLIEKEKNSGIVDALNIGLKMINTPYFIRMDGDDISVQDRFEILYGFMEKNKEIGVCGSIIQTFGNSNELWPCSTDKDLCKARLIFNNGVGHASSIFRTEVLKKNQIKYSNAHPYMEDYDLFSRLKKHTEFVNIHKILYHYRILNHNSTIQNTHTRFDRYRAIYKEIIDELNLESNKKNIELHLEFFVKPGITFKIKDYREWLDLLLSQNKKMNIYPQRALEGTLKERWEHFFFKVAELPIKHSLIYFFISKKINYNQLIYLMKYKINKLIGRNKGRH